MTLGITLCPLQNYQKYLRNNKIHENSIDPLLYFPSKIMGRIFPIKLIEFLYSNKFINSFQRRHRTTKFTIASAVLDTSSKYPVDPRHAENF